MKASELPKPLTVILLGLAGGLSGAGAILFQARSTPESRELVEAPQFWLWFFLLALSAAVAIISGMLVLNSLRQLKEYLAGNRIEIAVSCLVVALMFLFATPTMSLPQRLHVLRYHRIKMLLLTGLNFLVALLAGVGIWLVHAALRTKLDKVEADSEQVEAFLQLRDHLQRLLSILGLLIGVGTLAAGSLRNLLISTGVAEKSDFPAELVLVYGAFFTVLVALIYVPTYALLVTVGRQICDAFFPFSSIEPESVAKWHSGRKSLEAILKVEVGVGQSFQTGVAVFAPLFSSLVSLLMSG